MGNHLSNREFLYLRSFEPEYGPIVFFPCEGYNSLTSQKKGFDMAADICLSLRTLGKTEIKITPIGLGMMEFSGGGGFMGFAFPTISQDEKNATVLAALEGGINWFDTAELYGKGVSEASLATALKAAGRRMAMWW